MATNLYNFTDVLGDADEIPDSQISQPISLSSFIESQSPSKGNVYETSKSVRPAKGTGQYKELRSVEEIDPKYRDVFTYPFFNLVQSRVIEDALYSDKSLVVCAPTGSGKTVVFEMAIVQLLMEMEDRNTNEDFKIIYMAPVKALCTERLTEWYSKFTRLGLLCIEVTGDTDVDFSQLQAYKIIITTPEKWDMLTRRWTDHRGLVEMIKLFLIDEVHILNDETRGPVLEAVVSRMKTIQALAQSAHRIEKLKRQYQKMQDNSVIDVLESVEESPPRIRFVAVSATVSNPEDVAAWLGTDDKPAVYHKFGDECRPVKVRRVVEGYPCADVTSIFKFDIILNYKLWPIIQKYHNGKPTLIFCNTRKSVQLTAETLSREITISFNPDQQAKLTALAATIKNKKLQSLVLGGVGCHHAGLLYEERTYIEQAFRNGDLPILITTTTLAMGVNLPAHLVIIKNTQQYVNGAYQEYSISTVLQMVGRAGRPQFDTEATAVIMTRQRDKARYQALAGGCEPLQSYLHKRLSENLNSEAALGTVGDVAQCVEWLRSTFLHVRAAKDPKRYLGLIGAAPEHLILKKIEELCVIAMNGLSSAGLITMDEASCIASTEAGRLMSLYYLDVETMKHIMKIQGNESLERLVWIICESHELADMHLRMDERRCLNALNRNNSTQTIRFPMKGKITTRQMKLNCLIQAILGCLPIPDPSINQEAMKVIRIADRICKCLVAYVTRPEPICNQVQCYSAVLNSIILAKCVAAQLWENSPFVSKQLKGIGPTFSTLLATAGKLNFMLLEESHPRDLERIMNKGPPAGNILRKQISLLPKYQLTATPIDENMVSIKLMLLNHAYLAENSENLTAGAGHKCYVVAGDSENHILMLRTFTDQDLISVYDGSMVYEIARKHNFEHKIFIHCISSKFAGVDVRCEYTFTSINSTISQVVNPSPYHGRIEDNNNKIDVTTMPADITKEKKRKNNNEGITQSKEKKKRDNTFTEKINLLKESFGRESNNLKKDLQNAQQFTRNTIYKFIPPHKHSIGDDTNLNKSNIDSSNFQDDSLDDFMDDAKIDSILNEIETEIIKTNVTTIEPLQVEKKKTVTSNKVNSNLSFTVKNCPGKHKANEKISFYSNKINKPVKSTNNYKFLELLEKNMDLSNESEGETSQIDGGFTEAIKSHVGKFLSHSNDKKTSTIDLVMKDIIVERNQESTEQSSGIYENLKNTDDGNFIAATQYLDLPEICVKDKDSHTYENKDKENYDDANINDINDIKTITKKIEDELYNAGQENELRHRDVNGLVKPGTCDSTVNISFQTNDNNKLQSIDTINEQNTYLQILGNTNKKKFSQNFNSYKTNEEAPLINLQKNNALTLPKMETLLANKENSLPLLDPALQSTSRKQDTVFSTSNLELQPPPGNQIFASINMELPLVPSNNRTGHLSHDRKSPYSQGAVQYLENNESMCCRTVVSSPIVSSKDALKLPPVTLTLPWNTLNESSMSVLPQDENSAIANIQLYAENYNQVSSEEKNISTTVPEVIYANDESSKENGIIISTNSNFDVSPTNVRHNKNAEFTGRSNKCNEDFDYSFSAEKVDIHTHFNENHKIRIIRRLKIDLDVKKIVKTKEDSNNMDHTQGSNAAKLVNGNEIICDSIQLKHKSNDSTENELKTSAIKVFKIIPDEIPEHHEPFKLNETTKMSNECIIDENNKRSDNETTSPCKDNKISNILQKYSKIIGKKQKTSFKVPARQTPKSCNMSTTATSFKPNRPFKITDLQHLNVTLPTFTEDNKSSSSVVNKASSALLEQTNVMNINVIKRDFLAKRSDSCINETQHEDERHFHDNNQINPAVSPPPLLDNTLEISEDDFKIDHSMFNPKTMLKNFRREEEIIPPPPEFGNISTGYSYSPETIGYRNNNLTSQFYNYDEGTEGLDVEELQRKSLFEDNSQYDVDLTPSKETETWILDSNNEYENINSQITSLDTCSIMDSTQDSQNNQGRYSNSINTRRGRLTAFKFHRKSKLKM